MASVDGAHSVLAAPRPAHRSDHIRDWRRVRRTCAEMRVRLRWRAPVNVASMSTAGDSVWITFGAGWKLGDNQACRTDPPLRILTAVPKGQPTAPEIASTVRRRFLRGVFFTRKSPLREVPPPA